MASNVFRLFAAPGEISPRPELAPDARWIGERVLDRAREMFCSLRGHVHIVLCQQNRVFLKCTSCGQESSGWRLDETPPTITAR